MLTKIYLDLDGVLVDFVRGAADLFGQNYDELMSRWTPGLFEMEVVLGISSREFFERISGEDFWANLPPYEYCFDLIDYCKGFAPVSFLTSPTYAPGSASGKVKWMQKHFGYNFRDFHITAKKEELAKSERLLIDDLDKNIDKFEKEDGRAILFPTWFNKRYKESKNSVEIVKAEIEKLYKL